VARLNLNGQMFLLTRTERSVSSQCHFLLNNSRLHRTTSAIVSMPLLAGGRKKRTFIGTIVILNHHKKSVRKRYVKSRRQRQRHYPSRCRPHLLFILPAGHSFTHTHSGFGPSKKESSSSTQGTGTNAIPIPSTPAGGHVSSNTAANAAENAERRQRRKERKEEKAARRAKKATREEQQHRVHNDRSRQDNYPPRSLTPVRQQRDSRSPSPKRRRSHDIANRDDPEDDRYRRRSREYHSSDLGRFRDRRSSRSRSPPRRDSRRHSELAPCQPTRDRQGWDHNATRQWAVGTQTRK
jgi:hypothetical protein